MTTTYAPDTIRCPRCQSKMFDNRADKKNPKSPDFRCSDKTCLDDSGFRTALWERDTKKPNAFRQALRKAPPSEPPEFGGPMPWEQEQAQEEQATVTAIKDSTQVLPVERHERLNAVLQVYGVCFQHAVELAEKVAERDISPPDVSAMAATLFIQASQRGAV